jgi:hypothetical protein
MSYVRQRSAVVAAILFIVVATGLVVVNGQAAHSQAATPEARFATGLVTTDANGFTLVHFVKHSGGCRSLNIDLTNPPEGCDLPMTDRPDTVVANGVSPSFGPNIPMGIDVDQFSPNTFRARVVNQSDQPIRNAVIRISFRATSDPTGYCDSNICS